MKMLRSEICGYICRELYSRLEEMTCEQDTKKLFKLYEEGLECRVKYLQKGDIFFYMQLLMYDEDGIQVIIDLGGEAIIGYIDGTMIGVKPLSDECVDWITDFMWKLWDFKRMTSNFEVLESEDIFEIVDLKKEIK